MLNLAIDLSISPTPIFFISSNRLQPFKYVLKYKSTQAEWLNILFLSRPKKEILRP